ncbi:hypothetical protein K7432_017164 [Basidiobolus ranarum]|uniref:SCP domain-containing protein n=1 Tax=Basidiobolus ranarum TaxID=34480 RepID=A0ABR2WDR4_9FUNG
MNLSNLNLAAQMHSEDQAYRLRHMSHTGSDGSDAGDRISSAGFQWRRYGENVAQGYRSETQVMSSWLKSPPHRKNILNPGFTHFGAGYESKNAFWTQNFATPRGRDIIEAKAIGVIHQKGIQTTGETTNIGLHILGLGGTGNGGQDGLINITNPDFRTIYSMKS